MSEIVDKIDHVYSLTDLDKIRLEMVVALSTMHLNLDRNGMNNFYAAYVKMVDRLDGFRSSSLSENEKNAQGHLELLTHAADLYILKGDEAYEWACKADPPAEYNLMAVRRFYRECIHGSAAEV